MYVFLINKICSKSSGKWYKIEISNNKKKENRIELIEGNFTFHTYNIIGKNYNNLRYEDLFKALKQVSAGELGAPLPQ